MAELIYKKESYAIVAAGFTVYTIPVFLFDSFASIRVIGGLIR